MENHCSDEDLLSYLDGEVSKHKKRNISQHLEFCWICRTRQAELEKQIQNLSVHFQNLQPGSDWYYGVRQKIATFEEQFENRFQVSKWSAFWGARRWMFAGGFGLCATAVVLFTLRPLLHPLPAPSLIVQKTQEIGVKLTKTPVHEVFSISEIQIRPKGPNRESRLEIWSDAPSKRFASKWTSSNGHLKHAIWDTGAKSALVYTAQKLQSFPKNKERKEVTTLAKAEPNLDSMEAQFMHWLEERPWKPIALLPDSSFWEGAGATMRVERLSNQQIRLLIRRGKAGINVEFTAIVGMDHAIPRLQTLKIESAERIVEFRLSSKQVDIAPSFSPVVFYPDHFLDFRLPPLSGAPQTVKGTAPLTKAGEQPFKSAKELTSLRYAVQAHYILHLAGVCLGGSVKVSQEVGGVRVVSEDLAGKPRSEYFTKEIGLAELMGALAEIRQWQRQAPPSAKDDAKIISLVKDVNALVLLGNTFTQSVVRKLPPSSLQTLKQMVNDHTAGLRNDLTYFGADSGSVTDGVPLEEEEAESWRSAVSLLAEQAHSLTSSQAAPGSFQLSLVRVKKMSIQLDELLQKETLDKQKSASLQEIKTGNEK